MCPRDLAVTMCLCFVCRLVSGNSIEEKLLKNGTKDLIREVAAQGNDYSMAFLTQVPACALLRPRGHRGDTGASLFPEGDIMRSVFSGPSRSCLRCTRPWTMPASQ